MCAYNQLIQQRGCSVIVRYRACAFSLLLQFRLDCQSALLVHTSFVCVRAPLHSSASALLLCRRSGKHLHVGCLDITHFYVNCSYTTGNV